jgi:hypothetical protein
VVAFGDNDHPDARFTVPWEDAFRLAGDALQEEADYDPPRWRHRGWPDAAIAPGKRRAAAAARLIPRAGLHAVPPTDIGASGAPTGCVAKAIGG